MKPWLRYDPLKSQHVRYALVALLATAIKLAQYPKPLFAEQSLHLQAGVGARKNHQQQRRIIVMNLSVAALGIDIAKLKFDVCLIKPNGKAKHKVLANTQHGFEQLVRWLDSHQVADLHACLEATGSYGEPLALFLFEAGFLVSVANPAAVRAFANAGLSRTKTDKADAELIARFCLAQRPRAWQPPAPELHELQALVRRLESLVEMRVAEENRLSSGVSAHAVKQSLEEHIAYLVEQIKQTEALIRQHISKHPDLQQQSDLLDSIPGIGETTAALLLAEIVNIKEYTSARQVAAYAGLVPRERRSGTSLRGRVCLSKIGNARLRKALYFPAITALRSSDFYKSVGGTVADARQIENVSDRRGDAEAD
jgi:transposase